MLGFGSQADIWSPFYIYTQLSNKQNLVDENLVSEILKNGQGVGNKNLLTKEQLKEFYKALETVKELYERDSSYMYNSTGENTDTHTTSTYGHITTSHTAMIIDPYRLHILNLVSLSDKSALADPGLSTLTYTLQNYLWSNLWFIVFERYSLVAIHGSNSLVTSNTTNTSTADSDQTIDIGYVIK